MEKYAILVDSGSQIELGELEDKGIFVVPLQVILQDKAFHELEEITSEEVFKRMQDSKCLASTSQPSPGKLIEVINRIKEDGYTHILGLPIASGLSATGLNMIATCKSEDIKITVVDTKSTASNQRYLANLASDLFKQGKSITEVVTILKDCVENSGTIIMAPNLEHLKRSGRLTPAVALLAGMLKIVPVMKLAPELGGKIDVLSKVRTEKKANLVIINHMIEDCGVNNEEYVIAIEHVFAEDMANAMKDTLTEKIGECEVDVRLLPAVVGAHMGIGGIGYQFIKKYKPE